MTINYDDTHINTFDPYVAKRLIDGLIECAENEEHGKIITVTFHKYDRAAENVIKIPGIYYYDIESTMKSINGVKYNDYDFDFALLRLLENNAYYYY